MKEGLNLIDVSYRTEDGWEIIEDLSVNFGYLKTGLIGDNGTGKTTVLRLLAGLIRPTGGDIIAHDSALAYLPQDYAVNDEQTVAETFGLNAHDESNAVARAQRALASLGFNDLDLSTTLNGLSGGERMRVLLAALLAKNADFILLDEPTNNLDAHARAFVYDFISRWKKGLVVVSHDRELLSRVDQIVELSDLGAKTYGGNYELYLKQKTAEAEASQRHLFEAKTELKRAKRQAQAVRESQERRSSQGRKNRDKAGLPTSLLNEMASTAGRTTGKLRAKHEELIGGAKAAVEEARRNVAADDRIIVDLGGTRVPQGKMVCRFQNVNFSYAPGRPVLKDLNLEIFGPERVALVGPNGSGKTTLVRLLLGELAPQKGTVKLGVERFSYLDQRVRILDPDETLLANIQRRIAGEETAARDWLARFRFYGDEVTKKAGGLSGGERMRAALAFILAGDAPPQLLILDEPTNNLDIRSTEQIESALRNFQGSILVISHDKNFLKNISVTREIRLG